MTLANCKTCGRLFDRKGRDICPACIQSEEADFAKISSFLREHRGATPQEVHEATEVPLNRIYQFIREGRLIAGHFPNMSFPCERCGTPITAGRFCTACADELKTQFHSLAQRETATAQETARRGENFFTRDRFTRR